MCTCRPFPGNAGMVPKGPGLGLPNPEGGDVYGGVYGVGLERCSLDFPSILLIYPASLMISLSRLRPHS